MHPVVASTTDAGVAAFTLANFPTMVNRDVIWLDPFTTSASRTIYSVARSVFLELSIPSPFKVLIEQLIYMRKRYVLRGTAPGRHMCRISNGKVEDTS